MTIVLKESHYLVNVDGELFQVDQYQQREKYYHYRYWKTYINGEEKPKKCSWTERETKPTKREVLKAIEDYCFPSYEDYKRNNQ